MSTRRFFFAIAFIFLLSIRPVVAQTPPAFDAIYVFGDSYCDVGNIFIATNKATPPSPPYYNGRFSNGRIWVEHIASARNLPMAPSLAGGTDYCLGGAEVTAAVSTPQGVILSVPQQVVLYLSQHSGKADPKALYIILGGGNDIVNANGIGSPQQLGFQIALGISSSELLLRHAGAKNFLIPELFDVGIIPVAQPNAAFAHQATLATNKSLNDLLFVEELLQGINIRRIHTFSLFQSIVADASHFGFTNITTPCLNGVTVCADPDHALFWDDFHPTVFGHSFFAVATEQALASQ